MLFRSLEGALKRVLFYATMMNKEITLELTKEALKEVIPKIKSLTDKDSREIQKAVAEYYNISIESLLSKSRKADYVLPRQIAMYLTRELLKYSFPRIGDEFGGRDHTTVMYAVQKVEKLRIIDNQVEHDIKALLDKLK